MAASGCDFLRFRRNTSRRAKANSVRATAPTTPPAMAALFDLEWDVEAGEGLEGEDVEDAEGEGVTARTGL